MSNQPLTFEQFTGYVEKHLVTIDAFENIVQKQNDRFDQIDSRFDQMEHHFDKRINELALATTNGFHEMDERLDQFEHHFDKRIDDLTLTTANGFHEMDERFADVFRKSDKQNQEIHSVRQAVDRLNQSTHLESASTRVRLQNLEARVA